MAKKKQSFNRQKRFFRSSRFISKPADIVNVIYVEDNPSFPTISVWVDGREGDGSHYVIELWLCISRVHIESKTAVWLSHLEFCTNALICWKCKDHCSVI